MIFVVPLAVGGLITLLIGLKALRAAVTRRAISDQVMRETRDY
jgi:hypothetical protein